MRHFNGSLLVDNIFLSRGHGEAGGGQAGDEEGGVGLHGDYSGNETQRQETNGTE